MRCFSAHSSSHQNRLIDYLVTDHRAFCQLAFERNSLVELAHLITSIIPPEKTTEFEEDEPESTSRLREVRVGIMSSTTFSPQPQMHRIYIYRLRSLPWPPSRCSMMTSARK